MARKRTSLASLLEDSADNATPVQATKPRPAASTRRPANTARNKVASDAPTGKRAHVKQQTVYLPLPVYEQLRKLAFEERSKMHALLMEGLDRVFEDRGLTSLNELEKISENQ